jgi:hypothetical protein
MNSLQEVLDSMGNTLQKRVLEILLDKTWKCRTCSQKIVGSDQYAGGGGIQGLERGTKQRPGVEIESKRKHCDICQKKTTHDRATGVLKTAVIPSSISPRLAQNILRVLGSVDIIEKRKRPASDLIIDHKFPMQRWGASELRNNSDMSELEIKTKFQLLKKESNGNHNLLKSRACEECVKTGTRGTPFGIKYFYHGNDQWPKHIPPVGGEAVAGCYGCGWYDFDKWRHSLNNLLTEVHGENFRTESVDQIREAMSQYHTLEVSDSDS